MNTDEEIREFMATPVELTTEEKAILKRVRDGLPSNIRKWKAAEQRCVVPKGEEKVMDYGAFLTRVIDDGIKAVNIDYADDPTRRDGSLKGFEECRGKTPEELLRLKAETASKARQAFNNEAADYWYWQARDAEVDWVCNVVSAILMNEGKQPLCSWYPTARAVMKAAEIVGVTSKT